MPWKETCPVDEKLKFIAAWLDDEWSHAELCQRFGISRKTGYKWLDRYQTEGVDGLEERSRAPLQHPNAVPAVVVERLLGLKQRHPHWGPKKIWDWLRLNEPDSRWPVVSTIGEIFKRHGLVKARQSRVRTPPHAQPFKSCNGPNTVWSADFKGQFRLGDGQWCYPLTISDNHSRFLLACQGLKRPAEAPVRRWFEQVFHDYGLPEAIRTDNGSPFASTGLAGLTRLAVWWIKLGIVPERIAPGKPQQNGRHERMHRTLKNEAVEPPKGNLSAQQRAFNRFRREYNMERPHEALDGQPPGCIYRPSKRQYPARLPDVEYADGYEVRRVRHNGEIKWRGNYLYVSEALRGEPIGLLQIGADRWQLYFSKLPLAILDEQLGRIVRPAR